MGRENAIREFVETHVNETLDKLPGKIAANLRNNEAAITDGAVRAFASVCDEALMRQEEATLGNVLMISFSFLRTGLAGGKGIYRIDVCDDNWLTAETPCAGYWEAAFAFDPYFAFVGERKQKLRGPERDVREIDIEEYTLGLSAVPQLAANAFLAGIAPLLGAHPSYTVLSRTEGCVITVGEYRDAQTVVCGTGGEPG
jgi:hypothetical protein